MTASLGAPKCSRPDRPKPDQCVSSAQPPPAATDNRSHLRSQNCWNRGRQPVARRRLTCPASGATPTAHAPWFGRSNRHPVAASPPISRANPSDFWLGRETNLQRRANPPEPDIPPHRRACVAWNHRRARIRARPGLPVRLGCLAAPPSTAPRTIRPQVGSHRWAPGFPKALLNAPGTVASDRSRASTRTVLRNAPDVTSTSDRSGRVSPQAMPLPAPRHRPSRTRLWGRLTRRPDIPSPCGCSLRPPPALPKGCWPSSTWSESMAGCDDFRPRPPLVTSHRRVNPPSARVSEDTRASSALRVGTCALPKRHTRHESPSPRKRTCHPER